MNEVRARMRRSFVATVALAILSSGFGLAVEKKVIQPQGTHPALVKSGLFVEGTHYISGVGGENAKGKIARRFPHRGEADSCSIFARFSKEPVWRPRPQRGSRSLASIGRPTPGRSSEVHPGALG
jgi:hypothetical protein